MVELNGETKTALGNAENIREQSAQLVDIARETRKKLGEYITYMNDTASSMEEMRATAQDTEESIVSLRAARAGEHGRGFAVVAEVVRVLAESQGMEKIEELYPLIGRYVNLEYTLPSGQKVKLLNDDEMYLGNQLENVYDESSERCYGVVVCASFLLVCEYGEGTSNPEIVIFKRR